MVRAMRYDVYAGETGNESGHHVCVAQSLTQARRAANRARRAYGGDGWSLIFDHSNGERIISGRTV